MNPHPNAPHHLTDNDLDEVLIDCASPATLAHLAACEPCGLRLATFKSQFNTQMSAFNQASLDWSQARSNTISRDLRAHKPTPRLTLSGLASAAVALLLVVGLGLNAGFRPTPEAPAPAAEQAGIPAEHHHDERELASDNAMLAAIDSAIVTPRSDRFGLYEQTSAPARRGARAQSQSADPADGPQVVD